MFLSKTGFNLIIVLAALGFAIPVYGATYTRNPADSSIYNPVGFNIDFNNEGESCAENNNNPQFFGLELNGIDNVDWLFSDIPINQKGIAFVKTLAIQGYQVTNIFVSENAIPLTNCGQGGNDCNDEYGEVCAIAISNDTWAMLSGGFTIPPSAAGAVIGQVSDQLSDLGTIGIIALAMALPILFYIARRLIKLTPKDSKKL